MYFTLFVVVLANDYWKFMNVTAYSVPFAGACIFLFSRVFRVLVFRTRSGLQPGIFAVISLLDAE